MRFLARLSATSSHVLGLLLAHNRDSGVGASFRGTLCPVDLVAHRGDRGYLGGALRASSPAASRDHAAYRAGHHSRGPGRGHGGAGHRRRIQGGGLGSFILGAINVLIGAVLLAVLAVPVVFGVLLLIQGVALAIWAFRVQS
jgi:hypothetical protein